MAITSDQLLLGLRLHRVARFQTNTLIEKMSVGEHSFRVLLFFIYLGGTELIPCLLHDCEEGLTGDIPSPAKRVMKDLKIFDQLKPEFNDPKEKRLCKLCDKLDLVLHIRNQAKFDEDLEELYEEEREEVLAIAKELAKTREVKKLIRMKGGAEWIKKVLESLKGGD